VDLTFEHLDQPDIDQALISRAVEELETRVEDPDRVEVVVSGAFVASVRARTLDEQEAEEYTTDRLFGVAAAKSLHLTEGRAAVVLGWWPDDG
jgi:hypothetical protein